MARDGGGIIGARAGFKWTPQALNGIVLLWVKDARVVSLHDLSKYSNSARTLNVLRLGLSALYYHFMHKIHFNELATHPALIMALPPLTVSLGCVLHGWKNR